MKPKITVITSTYWRPDCLTRCIQSVQRSIMEDYEHIIVNNHDPFVKAVYEDHKEDSRIKYYEVEGEYRYNLGAAAFNLGIEKAEADIVTYVLDDDIMYENHLQVHLDAMKTTGKPSVMSAMDCAQVPVPKRKMEHILQYTLKDLKKMTYTSHNPDVGGLTHIKDIKEEWILQSDLRSGWEDDVFISRIKTPFKSVSETTTLKVATDGHNRPDTKGLDKSYLDSLMKKLVKDDRTKSGYRLVDDSPYVYPELKYRLFNNFR